VRAFLIDDEPLALRRLERMIRETGKLEIAGSSSDPVDAIAQVSEARADVLFLDIEMPGLNGFQLLQQLDPQPLVIFTTAYNQYALQAFEVNSVDYLLKPIERVHLERALRKLERSAAAPRPDLTGVLQQLLDLKKAAYPDRIASKSGEKVEFVDLARVTHFFAQDKMTYAATEAKNYLIDSPIADLESKLDPEKFFRVHRSTLVNLRFVHELYPYFTGRMLLRLKDPKRTEITVSRDRVKPLKEKLGL
jgi:two-component system LytT family response regulator